MNLYELISNALWPLVVLFLGVFYKKMIDERKTVTLKFLPGVEITLGEKEANGELGDLIHELYNTFDKALKEDHQAFFIKLLKTDQNVSVNVAIPGFDRENKDQLGMLRALRGIGLIRPIGEGKWEADKIIEITNFGRKYKSFWIDKKNQSL